MTATPVGEIQFRFHHVHTEIIRFLEGLSEAQFSWQPHPSANPIAFFAWHLARWADYVQSNSAFNSRREPRRQIWHVENLATQWGLDSATLGEYETGWEMDPAGAARLSLPSKAILLDYLRRCQAAEEETLAVLDDELF